jgi:uncharacterized protein (TIGR02246 family)
MEQEIQAETAAFAAALSRGDAGELAALYAEDARILAPTAELVAGRDEIEAYWRAGIALGVSMIELETDEVDLVGAVAIEIGRYALSVAGDGNDPALDRGKYVVVHREQSDGSCRRVVEVFNPEGGTKR